MKNFNALFVLMVPGLFAACVAGSDATESGQSDSSCLTPTELIVQTRGEMSAEDDFYKDVVFNDEMSDVSRIADVNGDGFQDYVVFPGMSYAGATVDLVVRVSDGQGCAGERVLTTSGAGIVVRDTKTNGYNDLVVQDSQNCTAFETAYSFDGKAYVAGETVSQEVCK